MSTSSDAAAIRAARFRTLSALPMEETATDGGGYSLLGSLKEILGRREMLGLMVRRDLKARYKDSSLGFFWSLVRPLTQLAIYYVVLGQFLGAARGIPDFAIYVFTGLTAYTLFSEIVLGGAGSIVGNAGLVKKIYLPREIFPLASIGSAIFNFTIQLGILLLATLVLGAFPIHPGLAYVIPSLAILLVFGAALALLLAAINVFLRDVQYLIEVVVMLLMWASPIVYSWSMVKNVVQPWVLDLYTNNPITLAVLGFQKAFWTAGADASYPDDLLLRQGIAILVGLVGLVAAHAVFNRMQGDFAQAL
ncbi:transport permease protein [Agromyces luteolus]|uniref:Transport permease protein n=1 Tax=Agromyces luteolus TaxID=88373 RepID=A0A7C9LEF7_9MICO|nr:ABC transporter permease [Agromyces luteolus]MUN07030.1 ABC transporter permease [Agromyces luteolus]GLK28362.1 transport permease protein [Agromyces luteolus]